MIYINHFCLQLTIAYYSSRALNQYDINDFNVQNVILVSTHADFSRDVPFARDIPRYLIIYSIL